MKDKLELRMKQNVAGEFYCLIVDVCHDMRTSDDPIYGIMDDAITTRRTPTGMLVVTIDNNPKALAGLFYDLLTWGDPFGGFDPEVSYRFRPFQRMAWQTHSHMLAHKMFCECDEPRIKKDSYDMGSNIHWMTFCKRCHCPTK